MRGLRESAARGSERLRQVSETHGNGSPSQIGDDARFRWGSPLGIGVALFLPYGVLNLIVGLLYPLLRRKGVGPGGDGYLMLNPPQDAVLFGRPPAEVIHESQPLATYRGLATDLMSGLWFAFGAFQLALVWFGLRRGQVWAWWAVVLARMGQIAGWLLVLRPYLQRGVKLSLFMPPLPLYSLFVLPFAAALSWIGLRRPAGGR